VGKQIFADLFFTKSPDTLICALFHNPHRVNI
jgi:hypothetical protein